MKEGPNWTDLVAVDAVLGELFICGGSFAFTNYGHDIFAQVGTCGTTASITDSTRSRSYASPSSEAHRGGVTLLGRPCK